MDPQYVWAALGVLCIISLFTTMALGIRNIRSEDLTDPEEQL